MTKESALKVLLDEYPQGRKFEGFFRNVDITVLPGRYALVQKRNAPVAGFLIEQTARQERRGETADDAFFDELFHSATALYHLNQRVVSSDRGDLGPLPAEARALLAALGLLWLGIGVYVGRDLLKEKRKKR